METDLALHFPHGFLDDRNSIRTALHSAGLVNPPARDVFIIQTFLQSAIDNITEGLLPDDSSKLRRSGMGEKKLMQWRDFLLVLRSIVVSYGR